jgi:cardiolipin synthase
MTTRILTPSNQITLLRLVFVPVFAILVMDRHYRAALVVLMAAALSDALDGTVARLLKQESPLGVALDPIADKILMTTAYITLSLRGALPWWLTIIVLSRDVAILMTAALISLVAGYRPFYPSLLGKASTAAQMATIFLAVGRRARVPYLTAEVVTFFIYLTAALTLASAIHYVFLLRQGHGRREVEEQKGSGESQVTSDEQAEQKGSDK